VDQGRRYQLAQEFKNNPDTIQDNDMRTKLRARMAKTPSDYVKPKHPPMWSLVNIAQLPEAVMHLAMGISKAVAKFIHAWAASRNKSPYLTERMNFCINLHRQYCRVGRCPTATYSSLGKFPGWVADTFRTWWIWMPWLYSSLDSAMFDHVTYVFPTKPFTKWNGKKCKTFLKSRGHIGYSKLNAEESKQMVHTMSLAANWPPAEVIPPGYAISVDEIQVMLRHCHSLFKHLFAEPHTPQHQHAADIHAKLLLSTITRLDRLMHPNDNLPNLYKVKYNFISLPRAVSLLAVYGSARNIQEGGTDGEGVVKMLCPLTPRGLKQHFARNLMDAYHRDQQLQELCEDVCLQLASTKSSTAGERADIDRLTA
jgi:hypothetical protein